MAYIHQIPPEEASGLLARIYDGGRAREGVVANILKLMSLDPQVTNSSTQMYLKLMKSPNALSAAQREMVATVVSNVNDCYY